MLTSRKLNEFGEAHYFRRKAESEDHVLLFAPTGAFSSHPYTNEKLPYDPAALAPIARVTNTIVAFSVPSSLSVNTMKDLLDMVKRDPGKLNWASATPTNEFLFQGYLKEAGLDMAKVPYRDTVSAINDLAEGRIQMYVGAYAIVRSQLQSGKVKVLAVLNKERARGASDIPTMREGGLPKLEFDGLVGIFGPAKLPEAVRNQIAADVKQVVGEPEINAKVPEIAALHAHHDGRIVADPGPIEAQIRLFDRLRNTRTDTGNNEVELMPVSDSIQVAALSASY